MGYAAHVFCHSPAIMLPQCHESARLRAETRHLTQRAACVPQFTPEASVQKQLAYLSGVTQATDNGRFVDYAGKDMPW